MRRARKLRAHRPSYAVRRYARPLKIMTEESAFIFEKKKTCADNYKAPCYIRRRKRIPRGGRARPQRSSGIRFTPIGVYVYIYTVARKIYANDNDVESGFSIVPH